MSSPRTRQNPLTKGQRRRAEQRGAERRRKLARLLTIGALVVLLLTGGGYWAVSAIQNYKVYPPTTVLMHREVMPPQRIMTVPIEDPIQGHVLEHGSHRPGAPSGVIVSYNCVKFSCEPGLIQNLTQIDERYPDGVYLAPYPGMDAKIALTTLRKLEVLDTLDADRITRFIDAQLKS